MQTTQLWWAYSMGMRIVWPLTPMNHLRLKIGVGKNESCFNATKTVELIFDFRKDSPHHPVLSIDGSEIKQENNVRYLGTTISCKLSWEDNVQGIYSNCQKKLYLLRKLNNFGVTNNIKNAFFRSCILSVLSFNVISFWVNANVSDKEKLFRVVRQASKLTCIDLDLDVYVDELYWKQVCKIMNDPTHPLYPCFSYLPSGRRLRAHKVRLSRTQKSFIPYSISLFNEK